MCHCALFAHYLHVTMCQLNSHAAIKGEKTAKRHRDPSWIPDQAGDSMHWGEPATQTSISHDDPPRQFNQNIKPRGGS